MSVFQIHDDASSDDFKMRQKVADLTFRLIPKIVRSLTIVSVGSTHISHQMVRKYDAYRLKFFLK